MTSSGDDRTDPERQLEISKELISHGADVNAGQLGGFTPIHEAAQNGNIAIAKLLLDSGADLNSRTDDGKTPLALTRLDGREGGARGGSKTGRRIPPSASGKRIGKCPTGVQIGLGRFFAHNLSIATDKLWYLVSEILEPYGT